MPENANPVVAADGRNDAADLGVAERGVDVGGTGAGAVGEELLGLSGGRVDDGLEVEDRSGPNSKTCGASWAPPLEGATTATRSPGDSGGGVTNSFMAWA